MKKLFLLLLILPLFVAAGPISSGPIQGSGSAPVAETDPVAGAINGILKANGAGTISAAVNGVDYNTGLITEITVTDGLVLTALQCSNTTLNNYGEAANVTGTLPTASEGLNFIASISTQHNSAFKLQRAGANTIIVDGVAAKTYITSTNQEVGSSIACRAIKTGAAAWTWVCTSILGTWTTD